MVLIDNFPLNVTPTEQLWCHLSETQLPQINPTQTFKYLHKLLLQNIHEIKHITLPNGTILMLHEEFKYYYITPTKLIKQALDIAVQLFCHPKCNPTCLNPCTNHHLPCTLKEEYISRDHYIEPRSIESPIHPPMPPHPLQPKPPLNIKNNPTRYPIHSIIDHKEIKNKDKYKITKKYQTFLYNLPNNIIYNKWMPQRELFPLNTPNVIEHNTSLLVNYYTKKQHIFYTNIINANFSLAQNRDTGYIPLQLTIPLAHISTNECNPKRDIKVDIHTIQIVNEVAHIYEETGKYLISIPMDRLKWLWKQYTTSLNRPHGLILQTQPFETEIVWLYQRYKYRIPKNDPLKYSHHSMPKILLDHNTTSFDITYSYFSSPITCSTLIKDFHSPFSRDKIFGSIGHAFSYK